MNMRRSRRSREHAAAHLAAGTDAPHPPTPDLPLVPQGDPEYITDPAVLRKFLAHVRDSGVLAFDTEFIGEGTYQPRPCLVQLATPTRIALVDPLRIADLSPIWSVVADPDLPTIVHAGASDLSTVRRALGRAPQRVVDVQVAAGFAGMSFPSSLATLVERLIGHGLKKGHAFTNWELRPLTASQLRYAADDVRFLPVVWDSLQRQLSERGRMRWVEAETAVRLEDPHEFDAHAHARKAARGCELDPVQRDLLLALCVVRDTIARREDLPHRTTVPDASMLEIVRLRPRTPQELVQVRGMPRPIVARHASLLLAALAAHPGEPVERLESRRRREDLPGVREAVDRMMAELARSCEELGIAPVLAASRADLTAHARRRAEALAEGLAPPPLFAPDDWRSEAFGRRIESAGAN